MDGQHLSADEQCALNRLPVDALLLKVAGLLVAGLGPTVHRHYVEQRLEDGAAVVVPSVWQAAGLVDLCREIASPLFHFCL